MCGLSVELEHADDNVTGKLRLSQRHNDLRYARHPGFGINLK